MGTDDGGGLGTIKLMRRLRRNYIYIALTCPTLLCGSSAVWRHLFLLLPMLPPDPVCLATFSPSLLLMIKIIGGTMKMSANQCNEDADDNKLVSGLQ